MELNIWTSSVVLGAVPEKDNKWAVTVKRADGTERVFHVNHVISATGFGGTSIGTLKPPHIKGMVREHSLLVILNL